MHSALRRKTRLALAVGASALPLNALRVLFLRLFFGYDIKNSQIGFGTILCVESAVIHDSRIGAFNRFLGPLRAEISGATIMASNQFGCGDWVLDPKLAKPAYTRTLKIQQGAMITSRHSFDVCATISIGENTWIAGSHSQFWTHGADDVGDIEIGANCYVGSAVRFSSQSGVGNNVLLALGSVVTKRLMEDNALVGGVPAKVLKQNYHWKEQAGR
jgi:hypothetical protein